MDQSDDDFFDLEEVEVLAKKKLPKPVSFAFSFLLYHTLCNSTQCARTLFSVCILCGSTLTCKCMQVYDYYAGGADTESTVRDNRAVYGRYRLLPRYMVDVSHCDLTYHLLGKSPCSEKQDTHDTCSQQCYVVCLQASLCYVRHSVFTRSMLTQGP